MEKTFVLSDESINSYGFRVLTGGINLDAFQKNPIMLWNHTRSWSDSDNQVLPIGVWKNLRIEDGRLLGEPEFDTEDEFAKKIARKVEKGVLKMASIGIVVNEESDAPELLTKGQSRKTVTRCTLREVSIVDIGSNANALALYDRDGNMVELKADGQNCPVGIINKQNRIMKQIALKLGLPEEATESEIIAKIDERDKKDEVQQLRNRIAELETEKQAADKAAIENLIDSAIGEGKITADKKQHFVALGEKAGIESLKETFACMSTLVRPTDIIQKGDAAPAVKKFSELGEAELETLRSTNPKGYAALYEKEFGFKPEIK